MSKLFKTMKVDLELKGYSPKTVDAYLRYVKRFMQYYQRPIEQLHTDEIRNYLHYLIVIKKCSHSYVNVNYSALKFFYKNTLNQQWNIDKIPRMKKEKKLPVILSKTEVKNILNATTNLKHKAILTTVYSAGLRISEVINLTIKDIDSKNMQIRVRKAKGKKDRYTLLSQNNLSLLRKYWKEYRPEYWLFPGMPPTKAISARTIQQFFKKYLNKTKITKNATVHTLRHCFATHLLEAGVDIFHIQKLLGHASPKTTARYIHLTRKDIIDVKSPFDMMDSDPND
jgi:site-specific recombinase XerD